MALEQDNGAIVRRFFEEVWNGGHLSAIEDLVDDHFTNFGNRLPGAHAAMRHIVTRTWASSRPASARIMGATPPTGRSFEADQIHIHRVPGGKIVEHAASRNDLLLSQLGLVSGTEPVTEASWRTPAAT